jgi:acetyl-CoA carboxylase biotin carboxyl carrier protein
MDEMLRALFESRQDNALGPSQISFQDVLQLVELIKSSAAFSELRIRSGDIEIDLRRGNGGNAAHAPVAVGAPPSGPALAAPAAPEAATGPASAPAAAALRRPAAPRSAREGTSVVKAPMVGTIYHAPEPGAPPFVKLGQKVAAGDQLCIIEVMKLMNAVSAESDGTVSEILVGDGEAVGFGQELFVIASR